jgi:hypothetical protein
MTDVPPEKVKDLLESAIANSTDAWDDLQVELATIYAPPE